jgi:phosphoribosylaminoimidazole-succinocarboxamide synthase
MQPIYEGKAKRLWTTEDPHTLRMEFKNDATAFNGEKKASFEDKGRLNNSISTLIYQYLEKVGVPTHFVRKIDDTNVEVRKVQILMVEVIVRNVSAGSFPNAQACQKVRISRSQSLSSPTRVMSLVIH